MQPGAKALPSLGKRVDENHNGRATALDQVRLTGANQPAGREFLRLVASTP